MTRIDVIDHDGKGFYETQGWGPNFVIPTRSDIFAPRWVRQRQDAFVAPFAVGEPATIRGRAFAGDRGIQKVEFSPDDGETCRGRSDCGKIRRIHNIGSRLEPRRFHIRRTIGQHIPSSLIRSACQAHSV